MQEDPLHDLRHLPQEEPSLGSQTSEEDAGGGGPGGGRVPPREVFTQDPGQCCCCSVNVPSMFCCSFLRVNCGVDS